MDTIRNKIRAFITKNFPHVELTDDQDIFALGFINSLFAMQLVLFVEKEFAIAVENEDLDIENFRSIAAIAQLIERKSVLKSNA